MKLASIILPLVILSKSATGADINYSIDDSIEHLVANGASIQKVATGYRFTEGGARDWEGNVYFTDIPNSRIHKWSADTGKVSVFMENSARSNGTWIDEDDNLIICQQGERRLLRLSPDGKETVLVDEYKGKKLNSPNDLWGDRRGGFYFSDPRYGKNRDDMEYGGEFVFYLSPNGKKVSIVEDQMKRPNGVIGTADGKTLYIADHGGKETYAYDVAGNGMLKNKRLFASEGSDGMALDDKGNVYLTTDGVKIYSPEGTLLGAITLPKNPSNVCFGGKDGKTLFITARDSVYTLRMKVAGVGSN